MKSRGHFQMKKFFEKNIRVILAILTVFVTASLYGNYDQSQQIKDQKSQIEELKEDLEKKDSESKDLEKDYQDAVSKKNEYLSDYNDLQDDYEELEDKYDKLKNPVKEEKTVKKSSSSATSSVSSEEAKVSDDSSDSNTVSNSYSVHITRTGSKYHAAGCQYLRSSDIVVTKSEAVQRGLTPCSRCNP